jgi:hypothetical protein
MYGPHSCRENNIKSAMNMAIDDEILFHAKGAEVNGSNT